MEAGARSYSRSGRGAAAVGYLPSLPPLARGAPEEVRSGHDKNGVNNSVGPRLPLRSVRCRQCR
jgi:hypothetical protein